MGLRLYAHTAVPTIREAAFAVGVHPIYLGNMARTVAGQAFMKSAHEAINNTALSTNQLIERLSRRAVEVIGGLMEDSGSESIRLKAATDLADRGSETSKIQKHQVESFTLGAEDARVIAESLVTAATLRARHTNLLTENFDKVSTIEDAEIPTPTLRIEP